MTKKRTKQQKLSDQFDAFKCMQKGEPLKRQGRKDGCIPTKPTVFVPDLPESEVLKQCMTHLRAIGIMCNRNNTGSGDIHGTGQIYRYGIAGGGDIIGLLPTGKHLEIEAKKGKGGLLSPEQQRRKVDIETNNGIYLIVHGVAELSLLLQLHGV